MSPQEVDRRGVVVVIAAYNEGEIIGDVVRAVASHGWTILVVDDGSTDSTYERLRGLAAYRMRHVVNRGQGAALQTGIRQALRMGAAVIVTFDADGQHDAVQIERLVAPVALGKCDVTLGSRFLEAGSRVPIGRRVLLKCGVIFTRATAGIRVSDTHNGFRALSRQAAGELRITMDRMAHASEILDQIARHRWRYCEVPVTVHYTAYSRRKGQRSGNAVRIALQVLMEKLRQ